MKKSTLVTIAFLSILLFTPIKAEAKGFGFESSVETEPIGAGLCLVTTTTTLYVFWIPIQTTYEQDIVPC